MAGSLFIKSTLFGGYDKPETDKVIEDLFAQVYELKNKVRDSDLFAAAKKKGADDQANAADVVAASAKELAKVQAENETLSRHVEELKDESKGKDDQIAELNAEIEKLKGELKEANNKLEKVENGEAAILSKVFIEAQKSADMVLSDAKKQADDIKADTDKLTENMVVEANNKAAKIVYAAEKQAAEIEAKAINDDEAMKAASSNSFRSRQTGPKSSQRAKKCSRMPRLHSRRTEFLSLRCPSRSRQSFLRSLYLARRIIRIIRLRPRTI